MEQVIRTESTATGKEGASISTSSTASIAREERRIKVGSRDSTRPFNREALHGEEIGSISVGFDPKVLGIPLLIEVRFEFNWICLDCRSTEPQHRDRRVLR